MGCGDADDMEKELKELKRRHAELLVIANDQARFIKGIDRLAMQMKEASEYRPSQLLAIFARWKHVNQ